MSVKMLWFSFTVLALCAACIAAATTTTTVTTTVLTEATTDGAFCPMDWLRNETSCYRYVADSTNFSQARDNCIAMGAHLVYISSETENDFVVSLSQLPPTWIGLTRQSHNGCTEHQNCNWMWLDNSDLVFNNFNDAGTVTENLCAVVINANGQWANGFDCGRGDFTYVCEQNVSYPTTTQDTTTMMITTPGETTAVALVPSSSGAHTENDNATPTSTSFTKSVDGGDDDPKTALIAGCVVGGVALIVIIVVVVVLAKKHRNSPQRSPPQDPSRTATKEITPKYSSKPSAGAYEDVDLDNRGFQATPADTNAHGGAGVRPAEDEGPVIYAEPTKKVDRRSNSGGVTVQENTLYAPGHMV